MLTKQLNNLKPEFISSVTFHGCIYKNCVPLMFLKSGLVMRYVVIRALLTQTLQNNLKGENYNHTCSICMVDKEV